MRMNDTLIDNNELYKDPSRSFIYGLRVKKLPSWIEKDFMTFYTSDLKAQKFILGNRITFGDVNKSYLYALCTKGISTRSHLVIKEYLKARLEELKKKWSFSEIEELQEGKYIEIILSVDLSSDRELVIRSQPLLQPPPQT